MATATLTKIGPQKGPQEEFLKSAADIVVYGGAAGGGKTFAELLEPLRHINNPRFSCVIFRRTYPQITAPGGLWDAATQIYPLVGGVSKETTLEWEFPSGAKLKMAHMQHETDKLNWQGAEVTLIEFDELCQFSEGQFFYLLSRNRSTCGVRPYVRGTCNPDPDSWVVNFISWWIDEEGFAIPERSGITRWMVRVNDQVIWADTREELEGQYQTPMGQPVPAKSVTFILSTLWDNKVLMEKDPGYLANLMALPLVERERLLGDQRRGGNWKIRPTAGKVFRREWFEIVDAYPADARKVRYWDLAATEAKPGKDPDWTAGALVAEKQGIYYLIDMRRTRSTPLGVESLIKQTAELDGRNVEIYIEQEPGSAGVNTIDHYAREVLKGYAVRGNRATGSKADRAKPASAAAEMRNVKMVRGPWIGEFLLEAEGFPAEEGRGHDDQIDAFDGAFEKLRRRGLPFGFLPNPQEVAR